MKWFVTCPRLLVTVKKGNLKILFLANSTETQKCRWRLRALLVSFRRQACGSRRCGMHPSSFRRNFPEIYNYIRALATKKAHRLGWAICPSQETPQRPRAVSLSSALAVTGRALKGQKVSACWLAHWFRLQVAGPGQPGWASNFMLWTRTKLSRIQVQRSAAAAIQP